MGRTSGADNGLPAARILVALARARDDTPADGLPSGVGPGIEVLDRGLENPADESKAD